MAERSHGARNLLLQELFDWQECLEHLPNRVPDTRIGAAHSRREPSTGEPWAHTSAYTQTEGWQAGKFRGIIAIDIARREEISRHDPP